MIVWLNTTMSWIRKWTNSKVKYSWKKIGLACEYIASQCDDVNCIVAVARGGLAPASIIANRLNIKNVYSIGLSSYVMQSDGTQTQQDMDVYQTIDKLKCDKILIVDDISDKGTTFDYVKEHVNKICTARVITSAIVYKPGTSHVPDVVYDQVPDDRWVVFPWEKE